jgi:hypothetical protein
MHQTFDSIVGMYAQNPLEGLEQLTIFLYTRKKLGSII